MRLKAIVSMLAWPSKERTHQVLGPRGHGLGLRIQKLGFRVCGFRGSGLGLWGVVRMLRVWGLRLRLRLT